MLDNARVQHIFGATVCSLGAFSIYLLTIAPVVQGFDSAELTMGAYKLGFVHPTGYPLYMVIGKLLSYIPIGNIGFRFNLMSAVFSALTVLALYELILDQTHNWLASTVSAFIFAVVPEVWSQSIRAEVYSLHTFLTISTIFTWWIAYKRKETRIYILCFILLGIGSGNHLSTILLWGSILLISIWMGKKWIIASIWGSAIGLLIAAGIYMYFPIRSNEILSIDYIRPYFDVDLKSIEGIWWLISGQAYKCFVGSSLDLSYIIHEITRFFLFLWNGLLGFGFILGLWGWTKVQRTFPLFNQLLTVYLFTNLALFIGYNVIDKEVMILPVYLIGTIWLANGINALYKWLVRQIRIDKPYSINLMINAIIVLTVGIGVFLDWSSISLKGDQRVYGYSKQLIEEVDYNTLIVSHWTTASVFDYLKQIDGKRPDVKILNINSYFIAANSSCNPKEINRLANQQWFAWLEKNVKTQPLCFIEPLPPIPEKYVWEEKGACWVLSTGRN